MSAGAAGTTADRRRDEQGFTLIEVTIATLILIVGITAIANLFVLGTSSNVVARHMTAATAQAAEAMEMLNAVPFGGLMDAAATSAGAVDAAAFSSSAGPSHTFRQDQPMQVDLDANKRVDSYAADRNVDGVGQIQIRWEVLRIDNQTRVVRVVAASSNPLLRARSRVELVTYRSCTGPRLGCPPTP